MFVYLYLKDKKKYLNMCQHVLFFLHFTLFSIKNVSRYPYLKTHNLCSIENMPHFFKI